MPKLSLDQFLRDTAHPFEEKKVRLMLPEQSEPIDKAGNNLSYFLDEIHRHQGMFEINGVSYDSAVFTCSDNIYFSYAFNSNSGSAMVETLFILSSLQISKTSDNTYELVESTGQTSILTLRT